ncbi:hypothetical protein MYCTH_2123451 [Thermothelomyces thermophilus ATCC 42464]|uniref:Uncharacterized protein n=1 Tax=Thermothelomyces thermophilus (strain ATCC 42464 / BCRC 31852 / DSM 1799) TaxID=573729 RepID=G2Q511_THET4|nr:uncharacterized protein MYCTH_2123451 [Thermothelomyces thermophilus ATCC 42464]AEO54549.1 hypothetical protein MYCTH_2123451 [Thermothelomyces thermophilus ATCC 42464]
MKGSDKTGAPLPILVDLKHKPGTALDEVAPNQRASEVCAVPVVKGVLLLLLVVLLLFARRRCLASRVAFLRPIREKEATNNRRLVPAALLLLSLHPFSFIHPASGPQNGGFRPAYMYSVQAICVNTSRNHGPAQRFKPLEDPLPCLECCRPRAATAGFEVPLLLERAMLCNGCVLEYWQTKLHTFSCVEQQ